MIEMPRKEFEERTRAAADFRILCAMPEFQTTIVAFFDEYAKRMADAHILAFPAENLRDTYHRVLGQNDVLEEYKAQVARWLEDDKMQKDDVRFIED